MSGTQNQFSCFVVGEGTLPIQCAELLLERGHQVFGAISPDAAVREWAKGKGIPDIQPTDNLVEVLRQQPFDYLFSIVNPSILSKEILEFPRQYAINFHDAPLPKYAGVNATSWALINREKVHGITWHVMSDVEGGDILKQVTIDIVDKETAFTLNGKCYEVAIDSFAALIDELSSGKVVAVKQNLNERTYFSPSKRPNAGGLIEFNRCAYDLDALVKALDFGSYPNPLGMAKLAIGDDFIIVSKLEVLDESSELPAGTITAIEQDFIKVSTISYELALRQVQTINGQALSIPDLVERFGLEVGYRFKDIEPELARRIEKFDSLIAKYEAFWVERLASLEPIRIPYAQTKVSLLKQQQYGSGKPYASVKMPVPDEASAFLESRHPSWNPGDFLFAAFVGYLARLCGTSCFDVGLRDAELGRELVETGGFFASAVPSHLEIDFEQSFEAVFAAVREQVALTKLHLTYARDVVVRYPQLDSVRELGGEQIFPVVIERVESLEDCQGESGNELTLIIPEDGKECCWFYNTEVLDGDSVAKMVEQFTIFLQGIVRDSSQHLAYLPLLSEEELHKILVEWNDTEADYPKNKCIHQLFEEQVERTPDAVAVVFEDEQLTYRELNVRANQLAHYLQKLGVGSEVLVGICVERSLKMVVGLLGILKAGGAYVPLDLRSPKSRLFHMLEEAKVWMLLTQQQLVNNFFGYGGRFICLDADWDEIVQENQTNPTSDVVTHNAAYLIYTSGSTGTPKGVLVEHSSLSSLAALPRSQSYKSLKPGSRVLQIAPLSSSASVSEILKTLIVGATLYLAKQESLLPGLGLTDLLRNQAITNAKFTPSLLAAMSNEDLPALQTISVVGENCSAELIEHWANGHQFLTLYGATEASVCSTVYSYGDSKNKPSIGRPVANTQIYILDSHLQPVPVGVHGELYIAGPGLARCYLNRPDLTEERFIPNPFSNKPRTRLYKTGDAAYYLADGNIVLLGRFDNQIKIRGFRVELEEIESILMQNSSVKATAVLLREDIPSIKRLVAYVVLDDNQFATINDLRCFLMQKLPNYMIPSTFIFLDRLPLTLNNKIDRRALPPPGDLRPDLETKFVAPRTSTEQQIAQIWTQILMLDKVGINDNFFVLGGHSLLATQVLSRLRQAFGIAIPLNTLFEMPTVSELSDHIDIMCWTDRNLQFLKNSTTSDRDEIDL